MKKSFENLTIVSVTGTSDYTQGSILAIQRSMAELKGSRGLLISPPLAEGIKLPENIEHKVIKPFSYLEYNLFIIYQLEYFIETEYCLIVQQDGWVLNGKNWRDEFWDYDYIGAVLPTHCQHFPSGEFIAHSVDDYYAYPERETDPTYFSPQNGGFCLRSKKMLSAPRKLGLKFFMSIPKPVTFTEGAPIEMEWNDRLHNEDMLLSAVYRPVFEKYGIKFAPSEIGYLFATESTRTNLELKKPIELVLGCHFFGIIKLVAYNKVDIRILGKSAYCSIEQIKKFNYVKLFTDLGYDVHLILER